jgi:DNA topoisomerase-1
MAFTLIIVESPAKCKKIENYLGAGYKCIASFGHIRELDGLKSINIAANFTPAFIECESKKAQIVKIRQLITTAKEVLLATDDDREGEAIAWHLCQVFGLDVKITKRILFHEVTESALKRAVANPTRVNMDTVQAQLARQVLDILVGYKLSPLLWKYIATPNNKNLSAGRCQTPALRLVYENQKEIEESPGIKVYTTTGYFTSKNLPFILTAHYADEKIINTFLEASVNHKHRYTYSALRDIVKAPPVPFTTSTIQQAASNDLQLSPKETMKICQKLYEEGYITYMRTDSTTYAPEFLEKARDYIAKKYGSDYTKPLVSVWGENPNQSQSQVVIKEGKKLKKPANLTKKAAEENNEKAAAHEAIRPTDITVEAAQLEDTKDFTSKEIKMYALIRAHTLESCMPAATYKGFTATISAPIILATISAPIILATISAPINPKLAEESSTTTPEEYRYSVEKVVFLGWKIVRGAAAAAEETENANAFTYLQTLKKDSVLPYKKITAKETLKDLKAHYSEARIVQLLEEQGIGRPSTFSALIEKIQDREYVKKTDIKGKKIKCTDFELEDEELSEIEVEREFGNEKNKLVIQPAGRQVIEFLLKHYEPLFQYAYTKQMEDTLDSIARGAKVWHDLCKECLGEIETLTALVKEVAAPIKEKEEIKIDEEHTYIIAKYGPVIKYTPAAKSAGNSNGGNSKGMKNMVLFKPLRHDLVLDLEKLRNGGYTLAELLATEESQKQKINHGLLLGKYKEENVYFKTGKFGSYIESGDVRKSVKGIDEKSITLAEAIKYLEMSSTKSSSSSTIIRKISDDMAIRIGQHGDYIFYKKATMKTPKFFSLNDFDEDYKKCDINILKKWIKQTYGV